MNNIKELRQEKLLSQRNLVALVNLPGFDISLLSKIENDICRPTPDAEYRICQILHCEPVELYGEWRQIELNCVAPVAPQDIDFEVRELMEQLKYCRGKDKAMPRALLRMNMDCSDRYLRRIIARANRCGVFIGNSSDGRGYYLIDNEEEGISYYKQEKARAISKLVSLEPLRKWLVQQGAPV